MKLLSIILLAILPCVTFAFESRALGDLEMRMRSRSYSEINDLLLEILTVTVNFLDSRFESHFAGDESVEFDRVGLSALSYDLDEVDGGFVATLLLSGRAYFAEGSTLLRQEVISLTAGAFQRENQAFLQELMKSSDPFLMDISYAIVQVDGDVVTENNDASVPGSPSFADQFDTWTIALFAGAIGFLVVIVTCLIWLCCTSVSDDFDEEEGRANKTPSKANTRQTLEDDSYMHRSPSPARSMTSQDSSIFTYNPKSCKSFDSKTFGSFITSNTGLEMDLEAWQQGSTVPKDDVPFGHDISAITNKKDLSLIEEGSEGGEDATPAKRNTFKPRRSANALTEHSLLDLEQAERHLSLKKSRSASSSSSRRSSSSTRSKKSAKQDIDLDGEAADVINDLKDLSFQIDRYRRR